MFISWAAIIFSGFYIFIMGVIYGTVQNEKRRKRKEEEEYDPSI